MTPLELVATILSSSSTGTPYTPTFPGGIIAWIVCYRRRRSPIGGWLAFYFWQIYGGLLVTLILFVSGFQSYVPESFEDPTRYHYLLLSAVPALILYSLEIAIGTMLVSVRTWDMLRLLRGVMFAGLLWQVFAIMIDSHQFSESLPLDIYSGATSLIWLLYFFLSKRVKHVFKTHDWGVAVETIYPDNKSVSIA